ncbi:MAG TPA: hypothetical protein VH682_29765 [Gemmataceae bacterium]|jgi:outer membrane protein assembly factor BamB
MRHARRLGAVLLLCLPGLGAVPAPVPPLNPSANAPLLLPAGIADPTGHTGYFASANGGIDAIDLATGKVLWQTHEAQRPLLLDGEYLLAQAGVKRNRLRILRLDRTSGECDLESDPVVFPAWVVTGEAHGRSFSAHWHLGKHQLILDWEASAWHVGKTQPTPQEEADARKHASGVVVIDLRTGQIEVRLAEKKTTQPPPALPEHLENKTLRWQGLVGQQWKVLALEERNGQQRFVLYSWDREKEEEQEAKELLHGKRLVARATLDERVLCLREASPGSEEQGSLMPRKEPSWWWLFSVQTGKWIGRVRDEAGMHAFVVLGKHVFYLVPGQMRGPLDQPNIQPRTLKAIDLSSGKKLWERPVTGKLLTPPPR